LGIHIQPITIIGAGGIGSPTTLALTKMGAQTVEVFDFDKIEEHNLPNQLLPEILNSKTTIGVPKVIALKAMCYAMTGTIIDAKEEEYKNQPLNDIVIAATDSMSSRKIIYEQCIEQCKTIYIDARMAGESFQINVINPMSSTDREFYEKNFYTDEEGDKIKCTEKAIIYNTLAIASEIANIVKRLTNGEKVNRRLDFSFKTNRRAIE
jgi:adenylyltransferase/sulfurtransferase